MAGTTQSVGRQRLADTLFGPLRTSMLLALGFVEISMRMCVPVGEAGGSQQKRRKETDS